MPNWTEHELHVVGRKAEIDRFVRTGYRGEEFQFERCCPLGRREPRDTYEPSCGLVNLHCRTRTQAYFALATAWDYAPEFYKRLPRHWPELAFVSAVNGEMGDFGGVVMVLDRVHVDLVRDYDGKYDRRTHAREVRALLKRWGAFLVEERPWRVSADDAWERGSMPFDAHFDGDFSFFFKRREEMVAFRKRYRASSSFRYVDGEWRPTR